jgi:hypothetical protein
MATPAGVVSPELITTGRACLDGGGTIDDAAKAILERTQSPVTAIKALMAVKPGLSLAEAKPIVHRNLPASARLAAEQLWEDLARAALDATDSHD